MPAIRIESTGYSERQWKQTWAQPSRTVYRGVEPIGRITWWSEGGNAWKDGRWLVELDGQPDGFFRFGDMSKAEAYVRQVFNGAYDDDTILRRKPRKLTIQKRYGRVLVGRKAIGSFEREKRGHWTLFSGGDVHERFSTQPALLAYIRANWQPVLEGTRTRADEYDDLLLDEAEVGVAN